MFPIKTNKNLKEIWLRSFLYLGIQLKESQPGVSWVFTVIIAETSLAASRMFLIQTSAAFPRLTFTIYYCMVIPVSLLTQRTRNLILKLLGQKKNRKAL